VGSEEDVQSSFTEDYSNKLQVPPSHSPPRTGCLVPTDPSVLTIAPCILYSHHINRVIERRQHKILLLPRVQVPVPVFLSRSLGGASFCVIMARVVAGQDYESTLAIGESLFACKEIVGLSFEEPGRALK
jgi:hypothetical protein